MAIEREPFSEAVSCFPQPTAASLVTLAWDRMFHYFVSGRLFKSSSNFSNGCSFMFIIKGPYSNFIFHVETFYAQPVNKLFSKTHTGAGEDSDDVACCQKKGSKNPLSSCTLLDAYLGMLKVVLKPGNKCSGSSLNRNTGESVMSFGAADNLGALWRLEISPRCSVLSTAAGQCGRPTSQLW